MKEKLPFVTVGVIAKNEAEYIEETINSILKSNYPKNKYEVLIVDGNSVDGTQELIKKLMKTTTKIKLFVEPWKSGTHGRARNYVADNAKGDYIAFTDGDCVVDKNWLKTLVESIEKERKQDKMVVAVGGIRTPVKSNKWKENLINYMLTTFFGCGGSNGFMQTNKKYVQYIPNYNAVYLTKIIRKIRYSDDLSIGEDYEFNLRLNKLNYKIVFNKKVIIYHHQEDSIKEFVKQMYNYGKAHIKIYRKIKKVRYFDIISLLFVLGFFIGLILSFFILPLLKIYTSILVFYFLLDLTFTIQLLFKLKRAYILMATFIYPIQHISYGVGVMIGLINLIN